MKHRSLVFSLLALTLSAVSLQGCGGSDSPSLQRQISGQKLADLERQRQNVLYELQLRQDEVDKMEASAKRPGVVGVTKEWLERRDKLREDIIQLKVKLHDIDSQIADLSAPSKPP